MTAKKKQTGLKISVILASLVLAGLIGLLVYLELNRPGSPLPELLDIAPATTTEATTLPPPPANVFDPADFVYDEDGYLTCTAGPYERGIDVSAYQGKIDWQQVADAGFTFVIIRVAGRGWGSTGNLYDDKMAQENYEGAKQAGLKVGGYFFSQAITPEEAVEEARYLLEKTAHWELDMPLVYDWERIVTNDPDSHPRTEGLDQQTLTDCIIAFCDEIKGAGKEPMVYFNPNHAEEMFHIAQVTDYPFWLAMYTDWMTYPYKFNMWQYTNQGSVPGIKGKVDINLLFSYE